MKNKYIAALTTPLLLAALLASPLVQAQSTAPAANSAAAATAEADNLIKEPRQATSYAIGVTTARNLMKDGVELDLNLVLKGMQDALAGQRLLMAEKDIKAAMNSIVTEMRQKMAANRKDAEEINRKRGDEFRAVFGKRDGVKTLANGVQYLVQQQGNGAKPTDEDGIVVKYRGTLTTGYEFDATPEGKTANMKLANLIVGWKEALKMMPAGSKWTIVIPPNLAYGVRGVGAEIGPNETLVFEVELIGVTKP
jgi:FKBP-type peptidyl-prolyl cis-trans isomerase FklB